MQPDRPPLRIALLTHSTNPRGGVVHAMELGDALHALGHVVTVHAPDPHRHGLFRRTDCAFSAVSCGLHDTGLANLVRQRINDYVHCFEQPGAPVYDIYHAQDSISANALATLTKRGVIPGFIRTVHHLDQFDEPQLHAWQERGVLGASHVLCVSQLWRDNLRHRYGITAAVVGNGVNTARYHPTPTQRDAALRERLGLAAGPVFLAVGGIEPRKNTLGILQAFIRMLTVDPRAQLIIAGGTSLLDHSAYRQQFDRLLRAAGISVGAGNQLMILDQVDDDDMPALFRCADALVFPSLQEGFGLVVLEAMACGTPTVVSRIAPFTEHLQDDSCAWVDPYNTVSIAAGMAAALDPDAQPSFRSAGHATCQKFTWLHCASLHLDVYRAQLAPSLEIDHA